MMQFAQRRGARSFAPVLALLLAGCTMGGQLHVTHSEDPKFIDRDVRFRTDYFFRVFDYCTAPKRQDGNGPAQDNPLANILPSSDALYRYRMTGRASALATKIRFESGVLKDWQIDPWGARVSYDQEGAPQFQPAPAAIRPTAPAEDAGARVKAILALMAGVPEAQRPMLDGPLVTLLAMLTGATVSTATANPVISTALDQFRAELVAAENAGEKARDQIVDEAKKEGKYGEADKKTVDDAAKTAQDKAKAKAEAEAISSATLKMAALFQTASDECGIGRLRKRGFQVLGPEGMRQFDPTDRLIMAVSFSAKPLISTLQEYASRVNSPRANPADRLLPLVRENLVLTEARAAAAAAKPVDKTLDPIFDAAAKRLQPAQGQQQ